ncbi:RHS repeat-associated core domain-containing protein [Pseudomonas sp. NFX98]|uniref:RHS repeat-associated core domain-containing protein n=1 Tax=Pseudomonas sp. NFX98 TaxID=3399122 RepID=UPI0039FC8C67
MTSPEKIVLCQYRYDALNWLVSHLPVGAPQHQRFYCKSRLATEIQGAVRHSIFQQGDLLLAQQQIGDGEIDTSLLATDQQRSVLHTLKTNHQRQPIAYSPYGHRPAENGLLSLTGFNGQRPDPVTGHYLLGNGYRAFNPVLMRFNSPDSLSPFGKGGLNSYVYCENDPINYHDETGHIPALIRWIGKQTGHISSSFDQGYLVTKPGVTACQGKRAYERMKAFTGQAENDDYDAIAGVIASDSKKVNEATANTDLINYREHNAKAIYDKRYDSDKIDINTIIEHPNRTLSIGRNKVNAHDIKAITDRLDGIQSLGLEIHYMEVELYNNNSITGQVFKAYTRRLFTPSDKQRQLRTEATRIREKYFIPR